MLDVHGTMGGRCTGTSHRMRRLFCREGGVGARLRFRGKKALQAMRASAMAVSTEMGRIEGSGEGEQDKDDDDVGAKGGRSLLQDVRFLPDLGLFPPLLLLVGEEEEEEAVELVLCLGLEDVFSRVASVLAAATLAASKTSRFFRFWAMVSKMSWVDKSCNTAWSCLLLVLLLEEEELGDGGGRCCDDDDAFSLRAFRAFRSSRLLLLLSIVAAMSTGLLLLLLLLLCFYWWLLLLWLLLLVLVVCRCRPR